MNNPKRSRDDKERATKAIRELHIVDDALTVNGSKNKFATAIQVETLAILKKKYSDLLSPKEEYSYDEYANMFPKEKIEIKPKRATTIDIEGAKERAIQKAIEINRKKAEEAHPVKDDIPL